MLDKDYNLKIADFGFSAPADGWDGSKYLNTKVGTESYMAPEMWQNRPYTGMLADVFSLGVMLFILTIKPSCYPFGTSKLNDSKYKFIAKQRKDVFWKYF